MRIRLRAAGPGERGCGWISWVLIKGVVHFKGQQQCVTSGPKLHPLMAFAAKRLYLCAPQHGARQAPLVGAVLKQNNLKQSGQDLGEQLGPLPQVLRYRLVDGGGGGGEGGSTVRDAPDISCNGLLRLPPLQLQKPVVGSTLSRCCSTTAPATHCCCRRGALAAWLVLEVVAC